MWQINELMWNISMHASTKSTLRSWKRSSARKGTVARINLEKRRRDLTFIKE